MKKVLWNITLASTLTLVAYIALYFIWGAILNSLESDLLKSILVASMTTVAFAYILLCTSKVKDEVGENEIISDYKEKEYTSLKDDFKLILKRESKTLISIAVIVILCFILNTIDSQIFRKKTISFPAFFFAPMCLFSTPFESFSGLSFIGYILNAIINPILYMLFLLLYRKKKYNYWMKNK